MSETKVSQGVWNNLDELSGSTDLKFRKLQKSFVKGIIMMMMMMMTMMIIIIIIIITMIIIIVTEVNKLMGNSGPQNAEDTVGSLMDGALLLANADQELNYQ